MKGYKIVTFKRGPVLIKTSGLIYNDGQLYTQPMRPRTGLLGFHFYTRLWHVYKQFNEVCWHRLLEVESEGEEDVCGSLIATNALRVVRELSPADAIDTLQAEYDHEPPEERRYIRMYTARLRHSAIWFDDDSENMLNAEGIGANDVTEHRKAWRKAFEEKKSCELVQAILRNMKQARFI